MSHVDVPRAPTSVCAFQLSNCGLHQLLCLPSRSNKLIWPKDPSQRYPQELHDLVAWCLTSDADKRPYVAAVLDRLKALQGKKLADPAGAAGPGAPPLAAAARL